MKTLTLLLPALLFLAACDGPKRERPENNPQVTPGGAASTDTVTHMLDWDAQSRQQLEMNWDTLIQGDAIRIRLEILDSMEYDRVSVGTNKRFQQQLTVSVTPGNGEPFAWTTSWTDLHGKDGKTALETDNLHFWGAKFIRYVSSLGVLLFQYEIAAPYSDYIIDYWQALSVPRRQSLLIGQAGWGQEPFFDLSPDTLLALTGNGLFNLKTFELQKLDDDAHLVSAAFLTDTTLICFLIDNARSGSPESEMPRNICLMDRAGRKVECQEFERFGVGMGFWIPITVDRGAAVISPGENPLLQDNGHEVFVSIASARQKPFLRDYPESMLRKLRQPVAPAGTREVKCYTLNYNPINLYLDAQDKPVAYYLFPQQVQ